jgi:high frequency lysogenization protein
MPATMRHRVIALAALFQAVKLVQAIARGSERDHTAVETCLAGVLNTDPESADTVFGGIAGLRTGLETLAAQLGTSAAARETDITRHAITILHLERKLSRRKEMLQRIRAGIDKAAQQAGFFNLQHPSVIASLADCYVETISTLQPRILVSGDQAILDNPANQNLIRALLLAAIRAAVLWRQCGGGRLTMLFKRGPLLAEARQLLEETGRYH